MLPPESRGSTVQPLQFDSVILVGLKPHFVLSLLHPRAARVKRALDVHHRREQHQSDIRVVARDAENLRDISYWADSIGRRNTFDRGGAAWDEVQSRCIG